MVLNVWGRDVQLVKCLPWKHKDLSWESQVWAGRDKRVPWGLQVNWSEHKINQVIVTDQK